MTFDEILAQVIELLQRQGRVSYRALTLRFDLDDEYLDTLKEEILYVHPVVDDEGRGLVWTGESAEAASPTSTESTPTPVEKILTSRSALEGERKVVTVCFADIKDSTELIEDLDPEDAQKLLDPLPAFPTGRPETLAPGNRCVSIPTHPEPHVQTAPCRTTPCCEPLRQAAATCWSRSQRRERAAATGGGGQTEGRGEKWL
jgi:hypothetical protein